MYLPSCLNSKNKQKNIVYLYHSIPCPHSVTLPRYSFPLSLFLKIKIFNFTIVCFFSFFSATVPNPIRFMDFFIFIPLKILFLFSFSFDSIFCSVLFWIQFFFSIFGSYVKTNQQTITATTTTTYLLIYQILYKILNY